MPVFAPGVAAGLNDSLAIGRQNRRDQLTQDEARQLMQQRALAMETERQNQARDLHARQGAGGLLYGVYGAPPPAGGPGGGPQPPPPGQSSAPPQPPQGGPPQGQPPQGGPPPAAAMGGPPQPPRPMGPPGMPPPQQGARPMEPMDPLTRAKGDVAALQRELSHPGLNAEQKQIMTSELAKAQARVAQLSGQGQPYQAVPSGPPQGGAPQGPPQGPPGMSAPPPVASTQPQQPSLLKRFVMAAQANGVPPEDLADQIKLLSPVMQDEMKQELAQLRGTAAMQNEYIRMADLEIKRAREGRAEGTVADRGKDEKERANKVREEQAGQRIELARKKAESGGSPTTQELDDPKVARFWFDKYKVDKKDPPFGWGDKVGRAKWAKVVADLSAEDGISGGELAGGQTEAHAAGAALTQVTKDLAAIRPFKVMLDKNIDIAINLSKKAGLSDSQYANKSIQWLKKNGTSDPNLREYLAQITFVQTEAARVLNNPRLVGQLTDSARHEMQEVVDGTMPLADTERVLRRVQQDGNNRVSAIEKEAEGLKKNVRGKTDAPAGDQDAEAIAWAKANPKDPRAAKILKMHGM